MVTCLLKRKLRHVPAAWIGTAVDSYINFFSIEILLLVTFLPVSRTYNCREFHFSCTLLKNYFEVDETDRKLPHKNIWLVRLIIL